MNEDRLLTTPEAAKQLGMHPETLLRLTREGLVPVIRLNARHFRYHLPTILDRMNRSTYKPMKPKRNRRVPSC